MDKEKGRILYELYCNGIGWTDSQGNYRPEYSDIPEDIQEAWRLAAEGYEIILKSKADG